MVRAMLAGVILASLATGAAAQPMPLTQAVWLADGGGGRFGLLTLPAGWTTGDAAVILLIRRGSSFAEGWLLPAALLAEEAAVLELDPGQAAVAPLLDSARQALGVTQGAGAVLVIGAEAFGDAALAAASQGFTAGIALDDSGAYFAAGPEPPAREAWPLRAGLLCDTLEGLLLARSAPCRAALR